MARLGFRISCVAITVLALLSGRAFANDQELAVSPDWQENFTEDVPVSGGVRVGIMSGATDVLVDPSGLRVFLGASDSPRLCVDILSVDGRYSAHLEYDVAGRAPGPYLLQFPTRRADSLGDYRADSLAVLAAYGENCGAERVRGLAVVAWQAVERLQQLTVFVGTGGARAQLLIPSSGGVLKVPCTDLDTAAPRVSYDAACTIQLTDDLRLRETVIRRRHFGSTLKDVPLPLVLP